MSSAATQSRPVRLVQVGAGAMGRTWMHAIAQSPDAELVGVVDLDPDVARRAAEESGHGDVMIATSLPALAAEVGADAVVNVTVPAAHRPVSVEALSAGLPVLCEKPIAPTVAEALAMVAAAEVSGRLLMISQSRRYFRAFQQFRHTVEQVGEVGMVVCEFFRAPHFGGFRERMDQPLLVDMAIHHFDAVRHLVGRDPVSVYCESHNPPWSWYDGDAAATANFELTGGARFTYTGSWCSPGHETSWNGRWRVSAEHGTALWDGDHSPQVDAPGRSVTPQPAPAHPEEVAGALADFVHALRTGAAPATEAHRNVLSLAMVEAAVRSARTGQRVHIADVLAAALAEAIRHEQRDDVRTAMEKWTDVRATVGLV